LVHVLLYFSTENQYFNYSFSEELGFIATFAIKNDGGIFLF